MKYVTEAKHIKNIQQEKFLSFVILRHEKSGRESG